ncbi:1,4-dihydroxy-2-naphthoate polyprenyltransferase [Companilactobacillus sp. RD055328]|uniref:1,4-dihydroxy-2-naphthoate polyprenyltransferase n=1 Tax=Companilactobacillus sp. RD055328 TaxID=2916634 RepID=UPI001FC89DF9|nr:1,4-dihydroxy-2-naphthoate polyprenyltransferase [Companilactobacillus sp. RD055328]
MRLPVFLELIEVQSLTASILPVILGSFYSYFRYGLIDWKNFIIFLIASVLFHMAVNVHDNLQDYLNADKSETFRTKTNVVGVNKLDTKLVLTINIILFLISTVLGIILVINTGWPLLALGVFSFLIGYFYASGPYPINRTPFAEPVSGFTMGFIIFLIAVYVNTYHSYSLSWQFVWPIFISSGLTMFAISNMLLANTICDEQEDIELERKTLVYFIGKPAALKLLAFSYITGFAFLIVAVILNFMPASLLLTLLIIPLVYRNTKFIFHNQNKRTAFPRIAQNLGVIMIAQVLSFAIGLLFN